LLAGGCSGSQTEAGARALVDEANATSVFEQATRSVVSLAAFDPDGVNGGYTPRGTGVVWAEFADGGFVVTSFHVVKEFVPGPVAEDKNKKQKQNATPRRLLRVNVQTGDATSGDGSTWYDAVVVGTQRASDIAVLRLMRASDAADGTGTAKRTSASSGSRVSAMPLGASESLRVGQSCYVVGAGGDGGTARGLSSASSSTITATTMSAGVVSGLRRSIPSKNGTTIRNAIQTDAEVPESAAGGALVDSHGKLIGMTVTTYGNSVSPGLGFAVPSEDLLKIDPALITLHQIS
jgi:S1-C subfamily serine protease